MKKPVFQRTKRSKESGIALLIAIFALLLITAIVFGIMFMSNTETNINSNYRSEQQTYFAAEAGLEEARDRMWNTKQGTAPGLGMALPNTLPDMGVTTQVIYITNPNDADGAIQPWDPSSPYYDDEICHEGYAGLVGSNLTPIVDSGLGTRCPVSALPDSSRPWAVGIASNEPWVGTSAALDYKWVRIAVKNNRSANPYLVDPSRPTSSNVACWDSFVGQEDLLAKNSRPGNWLREFVNDTFTPSVVYAKKPTPTPTPAPSPSATPTPTPAATPSSTPTTGGGGGGGAGGAPPFCEDLTRQLFPRNTVYVITSFAKGRNGGRKMVQYEVADDSFASPPIPGALTLVGPTSNNSYGTPHSANFGINGNDAHSGPNGAGCSTPAQNKDAISVSGNGDVSTVTGLIDPQRVANYTGVSGNTPDVATIPASAANWQDINFLNGLVKSLRAYAQSQNTYFNTFSNCNLGQNGLGQNICGSPPDFGSAMPKVTFVDGSVTAASGSGLLVVTGDVNFNGNTTWNGEILVIGDGTFNMNGGGNGSINGGVVVAKTGNLTSTGLTPLAALGTPLFNWNGGGAAGMQYDSCWANSVNNNGAQAFKIISYREIM